jgi:hypothetical protein
MQAAPAKQQHFKGFERLFDPVINPTTIELERARHRFAELQRSLTKLPAWRGKVDRIVKGGSYGKATCVGGDFDVDMVVFINFQVGYATMPQAERKRMLRQAMHNLICPCEGSSS